MRSDWTALPEAVTKAIADRIGGSHVIPAGSGDHAEIAATVTGTDGKVFVKAARADGGVRSLRYELSVGEALNEPHPPAIHWHFEEDDWLVVGFEHLDGRHADLSPGSPDLNLLAAFLNGPEAPAPPGLSLFSPPARLGFTHPTMDGDALVHTDLNPANLIITAGGLRIVDWAFAAKAAPWVELALLVQWLIGSGHTPDQAEEWLARFPTWKATDPEVLTEFALRNAVKWSRKARESNASWVRDLAVWTETWLTYRSEEALKQLS